MNMPMATKDLFVRNGTLMFHNYSDVVWAVVSEPFMLLGNTPKYGLVLVLTDTGLVLVRCAEKAYWDAWLLVSPEDED